MPTFSSSSPIRAVIFDFNGVIVDDEHVHFELFREVLADEGVALDEAVYHDRYLGFDDRGCFRAALEDAGRPAPDGLIADLIERKAARYVEVAETGLQFFPGAGQALAALAVDRPIAICSGALRAEIEYALRRLGVRDRVGSITSAEDTTECKPDPEGYLIALGRLRLDTPDLQAVECLVIEDSLAGLAAARSAGMVAVGVSHTYPSIELFGAGASVVVDSLETVDSAFVDALATHPEDPTR